MMIVFGFLTLGSRKVEIDDDFNRKRNLYAIVFIYYLLYESFLIAMLYYMFKSPHMCLRLIMIG